MIKKPLNLKKLAILIWVITVIYIISVMVRIFGDLSLDQFNNPFAGLFEKNKYGDVTNVISQELVEEESAIINVVDTVSPAVVSVVVKTVDFDLFSGPSLNEAGIGTGFIVDSNGLIITNSHVVNNSRGEYSVILKDGSTYEVEKIHLDTISDLAILEVSARDLPTVSLGDSDNLKVGQKAIAIGNALGRFQNTVTVGVVSGIGREFMASGGFGTPSTLQENAIQTDAALNPGNSGGPLLNSAGQVIGINVATTAGADNISFSIPVNVLKPLIEVFEAEGKIVRPYLGISYNLITPELATLRDLPEGAYVSRVFPDSPADKAGLERADIIVEINGEKIDDQNSIAHLVANSKVGDKIDLLVDRDGEQTTVEVTLEEAPESFR